MSVQSIIQLLGGVGLFLFAIKLISEALQLIAGDRLRQLIGTLTKTPIMGVLVGACVTVLIQSSSATTVMTVSFVDAGLMTLTQAIGVIMGANIGTTITGQILAIKVQDYAYLFIIIGVLLSFFGRSKVQKYAGNGLLGFGLLFVGMQTMESSMSFLRNEKELFLMFSHNPLMGVLAGTLLTLLVQSSAATVGLTIALGVQGLLPLHAAIPIILGDNIGTTITANLAALTANTQAKRAALAHFVFNVFGVIWVLIIFHPFMHFVNWVVDTFFQSSDPEVAISYKLSAFHSIFNICNVCILIWGVKLIERTVCALIHPKEEDEEPRLRFITGGMLSTAELSILQARKEIHLFAERTHRMFGMVQDLLHTEKDDDFNKLFSRIEKYENISDNMELEIANYLNQVSEGRLSSESKLQIRAMLREVTEIESIGDSCYNLARTINRKRQTNQDFTEKQYEHIHFMMKLTNDALAQMIVVVEKPEHQSIDINKSFNIENEINNYRNQLKNQNILDVNNKEYDYQMGVYYMDIIAECEKLGDYVVNVVEASSDVKEKKAS